MNNFKKNIFKKRKLDEVVPPFTGSCFCDTCSTLENCYSVTVQSTEDTTDIGVRYTSEISGNQQVPINGLITMDNLDGTFTYFVCSTFPPSFYNISTNNSIAWVENFTIYSCPSFFIGGISDGELSSANGCDQLTNNVVFLSLINNAVMLTSGDILYNTNDTTSPFQGQAGRTYTLVTQDPLWPDVANKWAVEVSPFGVISIITICA